MKLKDKRAVITGSSRSIGREIAKCLAEEGAKVVINASGASDASRAAMDSVVEEIRDLGGTAIGIAGAVDDPTSAKALVEGCVSEFGGIDILINNAGTYDTDGVSGVADCSDESWKKLFSVNVDAVFYTCRAALPHMVRQQWGRIINAGSVAGTGKFGGSSYVASKSALFGLGRAIAADYGPYGITVNTYNPEAHPSEDRDFFPEIVKHWVKRGYVKQPEANFRAGMMEPDGVAPFVAYLCTEDAEYLNGHVFAVDARRVSILGRPDEQQFLYRDPTRDGAWTIDTFKNAAPFAFQVENEWPQRTGDDLAEWELPPGQMLPENR